MFLSLIWLIAARRLAMRSRTSLRRRLKSLSVAARLVLSFGSAFSSASAASASSSMALATSAPCSWSSSAMDWAVSGDTASILLGRRFVGNPTLSPCSEMIR